MKPFSFFKLSTLLFSLFCLGLSPQAQAQSGSEGPGLLLGLKAGVNFDQTQGSHLDGSFDGYFIGGGFVGIKMNKVKVQGELLFSQNTIATGDNFKSAFFQYLSTNGQQLRNGEFKMDELSIPIFVAYNLIPKFLWLEAGPQYTSIISIKNKDDFIRDTKDVFKSGYLSGLVGVSLNLPLHLTLGGRYIFGLSDRNNTEVSDRWRTNQYQITLGYNFL